MKPPKEPRPGKDESPKLSRSEQARRIVEEYVNDLLKIIKKLFQPRQSSTDPVSRGLWD